MSKRARYNGQYPVEVQVETGYVHSEFVQVVPGGLLPLETESGDPVPTKLRDELIKNFPDWSEVDQSDQRKSDDKKDDA